MTKVANYTVLFTPEPEGGFTVVVPTLPGCVTWGKDLLDANKMAADAIAAYVASLKKHSEPVPSDELSFVTTIQLTDPATVSYV